MGSVSLALAHNLGEEEREGRREVKTNTYDKFCMCKLFPVNFWQGH